MLRRILLVGVIGAGALGGLSVAAPQHAAAAGPVQVTTQPKLYPAWSTDSHNYVTRCANAPVDVSVNANGSSVSVDGQPPRSDSFSTSVALSEGQEFLISTQSGSLTATYHIRCLPSDFPSWTAHRSGPTQAAFLVLTPNLANPTAPPPPPNYATVFDTNGVPRWWFKDSVGPPFDAKKLANSDDLVWTHFGGGPYERRQLDGEQTATYNGVSVAGDKGVDEHDFQLLPNGNYLVAIDRAVSPYDLSSCGGSATGTLDDKVLQEVSSVGVLVRSFDVKDHIPLSEVAAQWRGPCSVGDAYHFNSIEPAGDDVIVSFRHLDAVYRLNMSSGHIIWKLGGTSTAKSLTVKNDPDASSDFGGQHDARLLPDGTLTIHDNRTDLSPSTPRAVRYQLDTASNTATLVEKVTDPAITASPFTGSARKLAGGDWVVSWGGTPKVDELTPSGTSIVFSLTFDNHIFSYRADPVTSTDYGDALTAGMDAQYPRVPGGPGAVVPEAPLTLILGLGGTTAVGAALIRRRQRGQFPPTHSTRMTA